MLRDNDLIELPKALGNLARLKELHLQNNRLTALPPELGMLTLFSHEQTITYSVHQTIESRLSKVHDLYNPHEQAQIHSTTEKKIIWSLNTTPSPACCHFLFAQE